MEELANEEQLRLLISLHRQTSQPFTTDDLAMLTKWQAADRINELRGRPVTNPTQLAEDLREIAARRAAVLSADQPTEMAPQASVKAPAK